MVKSVRTIGSRSRCIRFGEFATCGCAYIGWRGQSFTEQDLTFNDESCSCAYAAAVAGTASVDTVNNLSSTSDVLQRQQATLLN